MLIEDWELLPEGLLLAIQEAKSAAVMAEPGAFAVAEGGRIEVNEQSSAQILHIANELCVAVRMN